MAVASVVRQTPSSAELPFPADTMAEAQTSAPSDGSTSAQPKEGARPQYADMVRAALEALQDKGGSPRKAIVKHIVAQHNVNEKQANNKLRLLLRKLVKSGVLLETKGEGGCWAYKLAGTEEAKSSAQSTAQTTARGQKSVKQASKKPRKPKAPRKTTPKKPGNKGRKAK